MFKDGGVYKIDMIKLAKERSKSCTGESRYYKQYLNTYYNRFDIEIFNKWNTFIYKGCSSEYCEIELESGYVTIPFKIVTEVN